MSNRLFTIIFLIVAFPFISIFLILFYRQLRINQKAGILMQQQNEQIKIQRETVEKQTGEISDHLKYARIFQSAVLTLQSTFEENFSEHFIFFKPKFFKGPRRFAGMTRGAAIIYNINYMSFFIHTYSRNLFFNLFHYS